MKICNSVLSLNLNESTNAHVESSNESSLDESEMTTEFSGTDGVHARISEEIKLKINEGFNNCMIN